MPCASRSDPITSSCSLFKFTNSGNGNEAQITQALMKTLLSVICLASTATACCHAGSAEDKAFTDKYKTAFESKDTKPLESFLFTTGSDPGALEFYKMMMTGEAGSKSGSIELAALTPDEMKKAGEPQEGPCGKMC